jgi:hypothetical protein
MRLTPRSRALPRRRAGIAALIVGGVVAAAALAGCSAIASPASAPSPAASAPSRGIGVGRGGVSGVIAAAQPGLLQVQGGGIQTAVSYTAKTRIRRTQKAGAGSIAVGDCIVAVTAHGAAAATSVTVDAASGSGVCPTGFGAGRGAGGGVFPRPPRAPGGATPRPRPSIGPGRAVFGRLTVGKVTAATAGAITVATTTRGGSTTTQSVGLDAKTVVTVTVDVTAAAIADGLCVRATGAADTAGGFAATALTLSDPAADGTCTQGGGGFGSRGFGGRPGTGPTPPLTGSGAGSTSDD